MKTNDEVRRLNLLVAIKRTRTAAGLADMAETSSAYLSQIKNRTADSKSGTPKSMGDVVARRIERALNEPSGWMDTAHPDEWELLPSDDQVNGQTVPQADTSLLGGATGVGLRIAGAAEKPVVSAEQAALVGELVKLFLNSDDRGRDEIMDIARIAARDVVSGAA